MMKYSRILFVSCTAYLIMACHVAYAYTNDTFRYPFYLGLTGGYGETTWEGLVPPKNKQNFAMAMSAPVRVNEGGFVGGVFVGYEFLPVFAVELGYFSYPDATVKMDEQSIVTSMHEQMIEMSTGTEVVALTGKVMMLIPHTSIRAYSSAGIAGMHRWDSINDCWRATPTFGVGFNYNITDRYMVELAGNYTAGYGEAELSPVEDYMPFVYSVFLRLGVRF